VFVVLCTGVRKADQATTLTVTHLAPAEPVDREDDSSSQEGRAGEIGGHWEVVVGWVVVG
jgi:hypothetical protein